MRLLFKYLPNNVQQVEFCVWPLIAGQIGPMRPSPGEGVGLLNAPFHCRTAIPGLRDGVSGRRVRSSFAINRRNEQYTAVFVDSGLAAFPETVGIGRAALRTSLEQLHHNNGTSTSRSRSLVRTGPAPMCRLCAIICSSLSCKR